MATTLVQQAKRAVDPAFRSQVESVIAQDLPNMASRTTAWATTDEGAQAKIDRFMRAWIDDPAERSRLLTITAQIVAGQGAITSVDLGADATDDVADVPDTTVRSNVRTVLKIVMGMTSAEIATVA